MAQITRWKRQCNCTVVLAFLLYFIMAELSPSMSTVFWNAIAFDEQQETPHHLYDVPSNNNHKLAEPAVTRNLRLAFIGDSLARYQYLSLLHYLHFDEWLAPNASLVWEKDFSSWTEFFRATNAHFYPSELCDCTRQQNNIKYLVYKYIENRYYVEPRTNNTVYFLQSMGSVAMKGRFSASQVKDQLSNIRASKSVNDMARIPFSEGAYAEPTWKILHWSKLITDHLAQLDPKPEIVILNAGLWGHNLNDPQVRQDIKEALDQAGMIGIYKTTTKFVDNNSSQIDSYEKEFCDLLGYCLDLSWTGPDVGPDMYKDDKHFAAPIYQRMNEQLFDQLRRIKMAQPRTNVH